MPLWNRYLSAHSLLGPTLFFVVVCFACQNKPNNSNAIKIPRFSEGITGSVVFKEGEFKSNGEIASEGKVIGVARKIYIYKQTNMHAVNIAEEDFLNNVYSELVDSMQSDQDGHLEKKLLPGKYSLFIVENNRLYSKLNDDGYYYPVEVVKDSVSKVNLEIDYQAEY